MNFIGAEISLLLEREDVADLEGEHLPGKLNVCADFLSRMMMVKPPPKPAGLEEVRIRSVEKPFAFLLKGSGPGLRPDLWGRNPKEEEGPHRSASSGLVQVQ